MDQSYAATVVATGVVAATFSTFFIFACFWYLLQIIALWRVFKKAGEPGWKSIIPIYNYYILFKITKMKNWFWWIIGSAVCAAIMYIADGSNPLGMNQAQLEVYEWGAHPMALFATIMIVFVCVYSGIVNCYRLSKVFGHGVGFTFGLIFFEPIFLMILGFGISKYDKKRLAK